MKTVSIVTVALNAVGTIENTIKSVISQTCRDIEFVVIDGGSSDGTLEILNRYRNDIDYLVSEPDRGLYHAMNKGARAATGDFIFFLNSDDVFCDEQVVADAVAVIQADPTLDLVYGDVLMQYGEKLQRKPQVPVLTRKTLCRYGFCHQALFARREFLSRYSFSEDYRIVADGDWLAKTLAAGAKSRHLKRDVAIISMEGVSSTTNWKEEKRRYLKSNFTPWELFLWRKLPGIIGRKNIP